MVKNGCQLPRGLAAVGSRLRKSGDDVDRFESGAEAKPPQPPDVPT